MELIDWIILIGTIAFIVWYGVYQSRGSSNVEDYVGGGKDARWWTIGLSVMATQASAITFLSTPGQAYHDGMGFVQFYFGLPIAIVIICIVFIPIYHRLKVYTAYEYLESRFDQKTRTLTAILFLIQRGLAAGITIFAPAIVLSAVLGWNLTYLTIVIGVLVIIYTVSGGTKAVSVTHKQQMAVILTGMFVAFFIILSYLPEEVTFTKALEIAGTSGKMDVLDFSFDFNNRYTIWSGIIGGTFLMLSYFGTDQSQVQRYLSGESVRESQLGMIFNGLLKVPLQFFILLVGVMVFVFYQFNSAPLNFNPAATETVLNSDYAEQYKDLMLEHDEVQEKKKELGLEYASRTSLDETETANFREQYSSLEKEQFEIREEAKSFIDASDVKAESNDKDYVFIHFILNNLPRGFIGLLLAVILSAAMSSTASELNALASTTVIDLYRRNHKENKSDEHYLAASKWFTLMWGAIAILFASLADLFDNLIQLVNIIGSIFYGNVLGIFLLAFFIKYVRSNAVFIAAIITQIIVIIVFKMDIMPYLWLNVLGCVLVMAIAILIQLFRNDKPQVSTT
ncbi:sodium:solute symporter [Christiangramia sp. OXR-203]|uniref:sodium:solute symporter n=1 Tax=Christiangramia sp. OXR-203 TaxID=3100176 RepID=UPI002AC8A0B5|nr:sodium:solute symporter [Christiangramia sp. OXR-203]WPY99968.1 sodium:solute symporter [Christiangramia sp. OXR-203]